MVRMRNEWVSIDPRFWDVSMDANINIALGNGDTNEKLQALMMIMSKQEQILQQLGPQNPLVTPQQFSNTLRKIVELSGFKDATSFFQNIPADYQPPTPTSTNSVIDLTTSPFTPRDNRNWEREVSFTGSLSSTSENPNDSLFSSPTSMPPDTSSPLNPLPPMIMFGKMTPQWPVLDSNWAPVPLSETTAKIGMPSKSLLNEENWILSRVTSTFEVTSPSRELLAIIWSLLLSNEKLLFIGDRQESESLDSHGKKPVWKRTQRIQGVNFGMDTEIIRTLSSMNSEEVSISPIYSDGSTDTLVSWKLKVPQFHSVLKKFGLPATSTHEAGTQNSTSQQFLPYYDD